MNKIGEAVAFTEELLGKLDRETDPAERCILLNVLAERLNQWTLEARLQIIQRNSKEANEFTDNRT